MLPRVALAFFALTTLTTLVVAHDFRADTMAIGHPWSRPTPPSAPVASGYLTLTNNGLEADRLVEIRSPRAERAEIHRSLLVNGVASMRLVEGGLAVEPGATLSFEAEKLHIMFIKPREAFRDGERIPATLVFANVGSVDVEFAVQRRAAEPAPADHSGHGSTP